MLITGEVQLGTGRSIRFPLGHSHLARAIVRLSPRRGSPRLVHQCASRVRRRRAHVNRASWRPRPHVANPAHRHMDLRHAQAAGLDLSGVARTALKFAALQARIGAAHPFQPLPVEAQLSAIQPSIASSTAKPLPPVLYGGLIQPPMGGPEGARQPAFRARVGRVTVNRTSGARSLTRPEAIAILRNTPRESP